MARKAFRMKLKPGAEADYKQKHDEIWPEMSELLRKNGFRNYSIHRDGLDLFAYYETDGEQTPTDNTGEIDPVLRRWWDMMEPYMEYNDDHSPKSWPMEEVFYHE